MFGPRVFSSTRRAAGTALHVAAVLMAGVSLVGSVAVTRALASGAIDRPAALSPTLNEPATATVRANRIGNQHVSDPFDALRSPDAGEHCAAGLGAADLAAFFAQPIGRLQGSDYQRALRLPDDRVLWTFQDAFIDGQLVHNAALIQSGRCFTLLNEGTHPWLLAELTSRFKRWHWILDGTIVADRTQITLFVVEMHELGATYLTSVRPVHVRRVTLDARSLTVVSIVDELRTGDDLYGWSITNDAYYTYLYSHCYQQFGYDGLFGFGTCVANIKVARTPIGRLHAPREYWTGNNWSADHTQAAAVVDNLFVLSGNNPAQIRFDGRRFVLVEKRDDWWGTTIEFGTSPSPTGPFTHVATVPEPLACDSTICNTYFASWVPWRQPDGRLIWSIGRNLWNGATTAANLHRYRPTFGTIHLR